MIKTMRYINWDTRIFFGFYESVLYNSDWLYDLSSNDSELQDNQYYDFYDDEQGITSWRSAREKEVSALFVALYIPKYGIG